MWPTVLQFGAVHTFSKCVLYYLAYITATDTYLLHMQSQMHYCYHNAGTDIIFHSILLNIHIKNVSNKSCSP